MNKTQQSMEGCCEEGVNWVTFPVLILPLAELLRMPETIAPQEERGTHRASSSEQSHHALQHFLHRAPVNTNSSFFVGALRRLLAGRGMVEKILGHLLRDLTR